MDRYEIRATLLENAQKMQLLFDEALKEAESFEITAYSEQITDMYKAVLEDMRAEYEERAIESLARKEEENE